VGENNNMYIKDVIVNSCIPHPQKDKYLLTGYITFERTYSNPYRWEAIAKGDFIVEENHKNINIHNHH
jgi:hypothetical protein